MLKYILPIVFFLYCSLTGFAQRSIDEKINSKYLGDTINCTVWLPQNWNVKQHYTTIYTFSYGASNAEFIAEQINYLRKLNISNLPPIIVVNIWADMDLIGYNYETGLLTEKGTRTVSCIKNEIIPLLESKYKASKFRAYIGQSYGASYGNYLFLKQPDIFSAYILMSPERIAPLQPPFEITPELQKNYSKRQTYYFIASGDLDIQRRRDYANDISERVSKLDSSRFAYRYENLPIAGHNNSLAICLPIALDFIYQHYSSFPQPDSTGKISSLIKQYESNLSAIYGIDVDKQSYGVYSNFLPIVWQKKDSIGLIDAIKYFVTSESDIRQLRDFAFSCSIVGLKDKAKELYGEAINKGIANQNSPNFYPGYLITCYRESADLADNPKEGWDLLQKGLQICLKHKINIYNNYYPNIYYYLGKFASENDYQKEEGIRYLQLYIEKQKDVITLNQFPLNKAYYYLGKCYFLFNDTKKAKLYLQMALNLNSNYKEAKMLLQKLSDKK